MPAERLSTPCSTLIAGLVLLFGAVPSAGHSSGASDHCVAAARSASQETGVPFSVLMAIAKTETGRRIDGSVQSWPWAVNLEGQGHWFATRAEAHEFAAAALAEGGRSFDIGCFQINERWHGENFTSLADMFEPLTNARYAAKFLRDLYHETGDWSAAAGSYHSRSPDLAQNYRQIFDRHLAASAEGSAEAEVLLAASDAPPIDAPARENTYPLLRATGGTGSLGSLVPIFGGS